MEYTTFGKTGMTVSKICLGTQCFGTGREWTLPPDRSREIIDRAIDHGINFFDTANIYSRGESERILGSALEGRDRDWTVVNTKVYNRMDPENPNSGGLSRKAVQQEVDHSLDRLGMDTTDLLTVHHLDSDTGFETTMRTLHDLVQRGKTRHIGCSSAWAWEFAEALHAADRMGTEPFTAMQNHYNLTYREEERSVLPLCDHHDIGVFPYQVFARGYLTRPHEQWHETTRGEVEATDYDLTFHEGGGREINRRVEELADEKDASMAQISLAWVLTKDWVDTPIVGVTSIDHLEEAVEALDISLSSGDMRYLEEPYEPSKVSGHTWPDDVVGHR